MEDLLERRLSDRVRTHLVATCCKHKNGDTTDTLLSADIGEQGIRVVAEENLTPGEELNVTLLLPGYRDKLNFVGKVIWSTPSSLNLTFFEVGIRFHLIKKLHRKLLKDFVAHHSKESFLLHKVKMA